MINPAYNNIKNKDKAYIYKYYECGTKVSRGKISKVSFTECINNFMKFKGYINVKTSEKGDCFYDSLSKFGKRTGNPKINKTSAEIRNIIIGDMIKIMSNPKTKNQISDVIIPDDEDALPFTTNQQKIEQLKEYLDPYKWFGRTGDIIPQKAAEILGINITIYDLHEDKNSYFFNRLQYFGTYIDDTPVIMLRIHGNHYRLLWPRDKSISRKTVKKSSNNELNSNNELKVVMKKSKEMYNKEHKLLHNRLEANMKQSHENKTSGKVISGKVTNEEKNKSYNGRVTRSRAKASKVQNTSFY